LESLQNELRELQDQEDDDSCWAKSYTC
jgi:hypothetical protein